MITWLFDQKNSWGYVPNLVKNKDIRPRTREWWDLCINKPYSYEFRFLKYCDLDAVRYSCALVSEDTWQQPAYYPINLNIYDPEIDYFELMAPESLQKLKQGKFRVLFYYSEGDDPTIDILPSLTRLVEKHGIPHQSVKFIIANWLVQDSHPFLYFPDDELYYRYLHLRTRIPNWVTEHNLDRRDKKTTCLMRADKLWRRIFASIFVDLGLHAESFFSYTGYKYETLAIEEDDVDAWLAVDEDIEVTLARFELGIPYRADTFNDHVHNDHKIIHKRFFNQAYWNIVVETHFAQDTVFLTEKTFKPILNMQPFVIVGNPGSLQLLKHLGYRTFGNAINERYDKIQDSEVRMRELLEVTYSLHNRSHADHQLIQRHISKTVQYNQDHFLKPKTSRIQNLLSKLEY